MKTTVYQRTTGSYETAQVRGNLPKSWCPGKALSTRLNGIYEVDGSLKAVSAPVQHISSAYRFSYALRLLSSYLRNRGGLVWRLPLKLATARQKPPQPGMEYVGLYADLEIDRGDNTNETR